MNYSENATRAETKHLISRLLSSLSASTFEMETVARLAGVVASRKVPTAAVECKHRPRLLINPDFVTEHCKRDEHLFLLVMHELWHVILAHTSLFPRMTQAQNIAFDAVINAKLMHRFRAPEYMGFFDKLNPPDKFPHLLLRPPVGWPHNPNYDVDGPSGTQRILMQLYPPAGIPSVMPFYDEILALIRQDMRDRGLLIDGIPMLLGGHGESDAEQSKAGVYLEDMLSEVVEAFPGDIGFFGPPGQGGQLGNRHTGLFQTSYDARRVFARVLRRYLGGNPGTFEKRMRTPIPGISGKSVLPNGRDRSLFAKRVLGMPVSIWSQPGEINARTRQKSKRAHVYLDVSGSMARVIPHLLYLVLPYVSSGKAEIYQFSTAVDHLPQTSLKRGLVRTTGGTNINCVLEHMLETKPYVAHSLIITDGYTGVPLDNLAREVSDRNIKVHVVLPNESPYEDDLIDIAHGVTVLPPIK